MEYQGIVPHGTVLHRDGHTKILVLYKVGYTVDYIPLCGKELYICDDNIQDPCHKVNHKTLQSDGKEQLFGAGDRI